MNDDFEEMARVRQDDSEAERRKRIDRAPYAQGRSHHARTASRLAILIGGTIAVAISALGMLTGSERLLSLGLSLLLPLLPIALLLFFVGGLAPTTIRPMLTDRERERLDD